MRWHLVVLAALLATHLGAADVPLPWGPGTSPRIAKLKADVAASKSGASSEFWAERTAQGTPLIEPLDASRVLVTFVYRGSADTTAVSLAAQLTTGRDPLPLERVAGTDVWFRTFALRNDLRFSYRFETIPASSHITPPGRDPLNAKLLPQGAGLGPSYIELPKAPAQPYLVQREGVPAGALVEETIHSDILKVDRKAWVYTPPRYDAKREQPYPVLICFDGETYSSPEGVSTPAILANLIAEGRIPPVTAIFIQQFPQPQRNNELSNNPPFADFVALELLPQLRRKYRITANPAETILCGSSAGGLAAIYLAFRHSNVFGNVIAQSAALWPGKERDNPHHEWLTEQYEASRKLPIRFVLQPGALELGGPTPLNGPSILVSNRHLRDVLAAKGYDLDYTEVPGGHEVLAWRGGIAPGLIRLLGKP